MDALKVARVSEEPWHPATVSDHRQSRSILPASFDGLVTALLLILLAPLLAIVALLVRLDSPGPALFRQTRTGLNGHAFLIYKFRTMHVQENGAVVAQSRRGDARLTRLGGLLRSTSLDELPQLINMLRGEMALVGPRALAHDRHYGALLSAYHGRFAVRPGITGWAQVNGSRGGPPPRLADMQRRIEFDLWFVENRSFALNLKILVATAAHVFLCYSDAY